MPAYFAPDVICSGPARDLPAFARLRAGNKWKACNYRLNGKPGTVAFLGDEQPAHDDIGWYESAGGLWYLPGLKMPEQIELVREHRVTGIDYVTSTGATITVPVAASSPRKLLFSSARLGDPAADWAVRAFDLFDRLRSDEKVSPLEPAVLSLISDALGSVYYVTPEILDELGWITSADIDPLLICMMGTDPKKAHLVGGDSSPSPVAG